MKSFRYLGLAFAVLFCSHAFAAGNIYFEECKGCDPGNSEDAQVQSIFDRYKSIGQMDAVSIMTDAVEAGGHFYVVWKYKGNNVWLAVSAGYARQASTGSDSGAGDGRTTVSVGPVIVMYPNPPTATVSVEGIIEAGAGGGGCTVKTSSSDCASLTGVNPSDSGQ
jgi:hypothetical protein